MVPADPLRRGAARWLDVLSTAECHERLSQELLGRVALSLGGLPVILPVLYRAVDNAIWFFTEEGTKLAAASTNEVVAFETDHLDADGGWSVLVIGCSREETDPAVIADLRDSGLTAGAPGVRDRLVCIPMQHLTGRSFTFSNVHHWRPGYA